MRAACCSDRGKVRSINEDRSLVSPEWGVFAVADGMGGHRGGEKASSLAVGVVAEELCRPHRDADDSGMLLDRAFRRANQEIFTCGSREEEYSGMGTTLTVALVQDNRVSIGHVGDSRAYYHGPAGLQLLTTDHSVVEELVRSGRLRPEEARVHPRRNLLTRALGTSPVVEVDFVARELAPGSLLLLCSDGLFTSFSDAELADALRVCTDVEVTALSLVRLALERDGSDNLTAVLVAV